MKAIPYIFLVVAISGIIGGAGAIVLSEFGNTVTGNSADANTTRLILDNATAGVNVVATQLSTIAIIGVMVVIIGLIAGVFVYFRYFR